MTSLTSSSKTAALQIREYTYRDKPGFLITGKDTYGRKVSIFVDTREVAEKIRDKIKAGGEVEMADFEARKLFAKLADLANPYESDQINPFTDGSGPPGIPDDLGGGLDVPDSPVTEVATTTKPRGATTAFMNDPPLGYADSKLPPMARLPDNQQFAVPFGEEPAPPVDEEETKRKIETISRYIMKSNPSTPDVEAYRMATRVVAEFPVVAAHKDFVNQISEQYDMDKEDADAEARYQYQTDPGLRDQWNVSPRIQ